jgi:hypothetical protein
MMIASIMRRILFFPTTIVTGSFVSKKERKIEYVRECIHYYFILFLQLFQQCQVVLNTTPASFRH